MDNKHRNQKGGFLQLIIVIVIALVALRYYHVSFQDVLDWFKSLSVAKLLGWLKDFLNICKAVFYSIFPTGQV
jgi:hypothetical protein